MTTKGLSHITFNVRGQAVIDGGRFRLIYLVEPMLANGWDAEELAIEFPHLTLGQIHGALAHYYDNVEAFEREMEEERVFVEAMRERSDTVEIGQRLRAREALSPSTSTAAP